MTKTNYNHVLMILCLSLIVILVSGACAPAPTLQAASGATSSPTTQPASGAASYPAPESAENFTPSDPDHCTLNKEDDSLVCRFPQENGNGSVTIELPWQGRPLDIVRKPFKEDLDEKFPPEEYISEIIYAQVIDPNDNNSVVHDFKRPLIMTAQYTDIDLNAVDNNPELLFIAIYDHDLSTFNNYSGGATLINTEISTGTIEVEHWTSHACWRR